MRGRLTAVVGVAILVAACGIGAPATPAPDASAWCDAHLGPASAGDVSVASAARDLGLASAEVRAALAALESGLETGDGIERRRQAAIAAGDTAAADAAAAEEQAWRTDTRAPLAAALDRAMAAWRTGPEFAEACTAAYARRAPGASAAGAGTLAPGQSVAASRTSTASPSSTPGPVATPTPEPTERPGLSAGKLTYTSSTSVGRAVNLTLTVRNGGGSTGRLTISVEGLGFSLKQRLPLGGCVPDCYGEMGADGLAYAQWAVPKAGSPKKVTVQLKARTAGTYRLRVLLFDKATGPLLPAGEWTVTVRVR